MEYPTTQPQTFCQCCGMPIEDPATHGTEKDGAQSRDYCKYCYTGGEFTPEVRDLTMEQMIELCAPYMVKGGSFKTLDDARTAMRQFYPTLKHWAS